MLLIFNILWIIYSIIITALLIKSRSHNYIGLIIVKSKDNGGKLFSMEMNIDPEELEKGDVVSFKVAE
jgi:hypothetical protein